MGELREKHLAIVAVCAPVKPRLQSFHSMFPALTNPEAILSLLVSLKAIPQRLLRNHFTLCALERP
jgi:hypothetical protein